MKLSDTFVTNRAIATINSMTNPKQARMTQAYCHRMIERIPCSTTKIQMIYKIRDMLIIKIKSLAPGVI